MFHVKHPEGVGLFCRVSFWNADGQEDVVPRLLPAALGVHPGGAHHGEAVVHGVEEKAHVPDEQGAAVGLVLGLGLLGFELVLHILFRPGHRPMLLDDALRGGHLGLRGGQAEEGAAAGDPALLQTLLQNLLDNARKAMESGGDLLLEGLLEEGGPLIRVTDSGKGIPAEELSRVTEAFYMVDKSRSRAQGGAGLGLALCRRIVDLHGGTLELESRSGEGTRATVRLRGAVP